MLEVASAGCNCLREPVLLPPLWYIWHSPAHPHLDWWEEWIIWWGIWKEKPGRRSSASSAVFIGNQPPGGEHASRTGVWVARRRTEGPTQSSISKSRKLTCPSFPVLFYSIRRVIICPSLTSISSNLSHFLVNAKFRKKDAIYWTSSALHQGLRNHTILHFPPSPPQIHRIVLSSRSHEPMHTISQI